MIADVLFSKFYLATRWRTVGLSPYREITNCIFTLGCNFPIIVYSYILKLHWKLLSILNIMPSPLQLSWWPPHLYLEILLSLILIKAPFSLDNSIFAEPFVYYLMFPNILLHKIEASI
jgi:hypothetical protein